MVLAGVSVSAAAQPWPSRPIKYVVNYAPGGTTDILARMIAPRLSEALGQPVVVENKTGQGGSVGAAEVARAAPDGYTIGAGNIASHGINASLYPKLSYDPLTDFTPITMLATLPNLLVVHPSIQAANVQELIALLKANPNKFSFGSPGNGTAPHLAGELFKMMTGTQMQHVPYRGSGQMIPDLLGGVVQLSFDNITTAHPLTRQGKLRALAVTTAGRSLVAPEVPTLAESGLAGYDLGAWQALFAPAGLPGPILDRFYQEAVKVLRAPDVAKRLQELGLEAGGMAPGELASLIRAEIPKFARIVKQSGVRID
jgi:tripartite-type tricarboxylate transporter receptor subunit TctC